MGVVGSEGVNIPLRGGVDKSLPMVYFAERASYEEAVDGGLKRKDRSRVED